MNRILFLTTLAGLLCLLIVAAPGPVGRAGEDAPAPSSPPAPEKKEEKADKISEKTPAAADSGARTATEKKYPPQDPSLGAIEGRVTLEGDPPVQKPFDTASNKDHAFCAAHIQDLRLLISSSKEVENAVLSVSGYKPESKPAPRDVSLENRHCTYLPRIQATTIGSKLRMTSSDPFLHNVHGYLALNFNKAISKGEEIEQKLLKHGDGLVQCDLHPWMQAWIKVFQHDLFDVSDAKGTFKLVNVPPGEHEIEVWHEFLEAPKQKVKVEPGKTVQLDFRVQAKGKKKS